MLALLLSLIFQASAARKPALEFIELRALKRWAVTVTLDCGSNLSAVVVANEAKRTVDYQGFRMTFARSYGGARLLFSMLQNPGVPVGVEDIVTYVWSTTLENYKTLVRVFLEIDRDFRGFHQQPGRGFAFDPAVTADYAPDEFNGFKLDWPNDRLILPGGREKELTPQATETLRLLFRARGAPVSFETLFLYIFPGRRANVRPTIMGVRQALKRAIDDPSLRLRTDEDREEFTLFFPPAGT